MSRFFYESFQDYLCGRGVRKVDFMLKSNETLNRNILTEKVDNQIHAINEVHKLSCGFNGFLKRRINNQTCKAVEEEKIQLRKFKKNYEKIKAEGPDNKIEQIALDEGQKIIDRASRVFDVMDDNGYMDLVRRSMDNVEICLTDVDFDNLGMNNGVIEIVNFDDISYNMVEMDCYFFLAKLKRKGFNVDFDRGIDLFCELEGLEKNSEVFIKCLLSYPHEFLKIFGKYRKSKKNWNEDEYVRRLLNGIREDVKSLI